MHQKRHKWILSLAVIIVAFFCGCTGNKQSTSGLSPSDLSADTPVGVGAYLNYADESLIIFQGDFGLFGYDLKQRKITFSVDLLKHIRAAGFQGSESVACVNVAVDGSIVQLYNSDSPNVVYYIDPQKGTYYTGPYEELENRFDPLLLESGSLGNLDSTNPFGMVGTLGELCFRRGDNIWMIFEHLEK